jgi:phage repressor protein C with HTH and peptisase S24 domain
MSLEIYDSHKMPNPNEWLAGRLRQLKGKNQSALASYLGLSPARITEIIKGGRGIQARELQPLATYLEMPLDEVIAKVSPAAPPPSNVLGGPISVPPINPRSVVEVLGVTRGGDNGWFELNGQVIDRVPLPPGISSANLIFALYVSGDSMWPRYEDGDLVYVHRDRPAVNGVDVVVELHPVNDGEAGQSLIKRLVKRTATQLVLRQHNPAKDIKIALPTVARVFRILTSSELMGVR